MCVKRTTFFSGFVQKQIVRLTHNLFCTEFRCTFFDFRLSLNPLFFCSLIRSCICSQKSTPHSPPFFRSHVRSRICSPKLTPHSCVACPWPPATTPIINPTKKTIHPSPQPHGHLPPHAWFWTLSELEKGLEKGRLHEQSVRQARKSYWVERAC